MSLREREKRKRKLIEQGLTEKQATAEFRTQRERELGVVNEEDERVRLERGVKLQQGAEDIKKEEQAQSREAFQTVTGSDLLNQQLQEKISNQPDLAPEKSVTENVAGAGLALQAQAGNLITAGLEKITGKKYGRTSGSKLAKTAFGKFLGTATVGATGAAGVLLAAPVVAGVFSAQVASAAAGLKIGILSTAVGSIGAYFGTKQVLDYKGGELETMRSTIGSMTEDGERIQALATQGGDLVTLYQTLQDMSLEIDNAEAVIKDIGNKNIQFRYEKEYIEDMKRVRSARLAIQRRVQAIENIAATGQTVINPEALMFIASTFEGE